MNWSGFETAMGKVSVTMRSVEELQHDIEQFDFRLVRETKVSKNPDGSLSITHRSPDTAKQHREMNRFRAFAEKNWTVREIDLAASFHPAGTFCPDEDDDARVTRTKIENTKDECFVERREPTKVNYAGFGFATWAEADAFNKALRSIQRDALMLLGACAALGLHGADFKYGIIKNNIDPDENSAFDATIAQLRGEVAEAIKVRT